MDKKESTIYFLRTSILLLIVSAVAAFFVYAYLGKALGWFSTNREVRGNDASVMVQEENSVRVARLIVYKYKIEENRITAQIDDPDGPEYMKLNEYDMVFTERQAYTPMILKVPLEKLKGSGFDVTLICTGNLRDADGNMEKNISNYLTVRCGMNSDLDAVANGENNTGAPNLYTEAMNFFQDSTKQCGSDGVTDKTWQENQFVTYTLGSNGKVIRNTMTKAADNQIVFHVKSYSPVIYEGNEQANAYFMLDYDENLLQEYIDEAAMSVDAAFLEQGGNVELATDLNIMKFAH